MGLERLYVDEIQDHLNFKFNDVDRLLSKKRLQYILDHESKETIMQKYAYMSYLVNNDIVAYSLLKVNYFKQTIFAPLFEGTPAAEIGNQFLEIEMGVREKFNSLVNEMIDKIPKYQLIPAQRLRKVSQKELVQKTIAALESGNPGRTIFDKKGEEYQLKKAIEVVAAKILKDIHKRIENGENQQHVLMALKSFKEGTVTEESQEILSNLIIEATVDTDLIKLPKIFQERISLFTHLHKKKVADAIVTHISEKMLAAGMATDSSIEANDRNRRVVQVTPEVLRKLEALKSMTYEDIAKDQELFDLVQSRCVGINLEKQSFELLKSESDAKLHKIIFNPSNTDIPLDVSNMTPEELEANGITKFKAAEIQIDPAGSIVKAKTNDQKLMDFFSKVEALYDKKHSGTKDNSEMEKPLIHYDDQVPEK